PFGEQGLVLVDVADAGEGSLVEEAFGDRPLRGLRRAEPSAGLLGVLRAEGRAKQVGSQARQRRVDPLEARFEELERWAVEADRDRVRRLEHELCACGRPPPALALRVAMPRTVHPEVAAELEAVVEANQEMLALGLDRRDVAADESVDLRAGQPCP